MIKLSSHNLKIILQKEKSVLVEAFLRYYDLLSFVEGEQAAKGKSAFKVKKSLLKQIGLAKQKLIFYLSYIKSSDPKTNSPLWQPASYGCEEFLQLYATEKLFKRVNAAELKQKQDAFIKQRKPQPVPSE